MLYILGWKDISSAGQFSYYKWLQALKDCDEFGLINHKNKPLQFFCSKYFISQIQKNHDYYLLLK